MKNVIKRQVGRYDLSKLISKFNSVARSGMNESPTDLFFNRVVRSTVLGSGRIILDLTRGKEKRIEEQRSIRRELGRGRLSLDLFGEGDCVPVQDTKTKKWCTKCTITSVIFHEGAQNPSSYTVEADSGGSFL